MLRLPGENSAKVRLDQAVTGQILPVSWKACGGRFVARFIQLRTGRVAQRQFLKRGSFCLISVGSCKQWCSRGVAAVRFSCVGRHSSEVQIACRSRFAVEAVADEVNSA